MPELPWGYLGSVLVALVAAVLALWPISTNGPRVTPAFVIGSASSEVPGLFLLALAGSTVLAAASGDLSGVGGAVCVALAVVAALLLVRVQVVAGAAGRTVVAAVDAALGGAVGAAGAPGDAGAPRLTPGERLRTVLAPARWPARDVEVVRNLSYGPHGRANRLDLYRGRGRGHGAAPDAPVLVHLHGGGFFSGRKSKEAHLLLLALARRGWVCVSADYRLTPEARYPDFVVDAKQVIAWVRSQGAAYGAGRTVVVCGGSAGANLALTAVFTPGRTDLQPGFEDADTSVQATICLYGYYGPPPGAAEGSGPGDHLVRAAPPTLVVHGDRDPMVPVLAARRFSERLRSVSSSPVVYAELAGAQHTFDRFDAVRAGGVVVGVLHFLRRAGLPS